jgi:hypothetical protein
MSTQLEYLLFVFGDFCILADVGKEGFGGVDVWEHVDLLA